MEIPEAQISHWFKTNPTISPQFFTKLISKLVQTSCSSPVYFRFPQDIGTKGSDGELKTQVSFKQYIPEGHSIWELSVSQDIKVKANEDFEKYNSGKLIDKEEMKNSTFIFATPLRWHELQKWVSGKLELKIWKDVRVIDCSVLNNWLCECLGIKIWFLKETIGLKHNISTPDIHWEILSTYGNPPVSLPKQLFLSENREDAKRKIKQVLTRELNKCCFKTRNPRDLQDFISAYLNSTSEFEDIKNRCVILYNLEDWENILKSTISNHILIASERLDMSSDEAMNILQETMNKGFGCIYWGTSIPPPSPELVQPTIGYMIKALREGGYSELRAEQLSKKAGPDLLKLLKIIQGVSNLPDWATDTNASNLAIANLFGKWDESNQSEKNALNEILGGEYGEWINSLRSFLNRPTTPLYFWDGKWSFTYRYEGWFGLGQHIFDNHLDIFFILAETILGEIDPRISVSEKEQLFAPTSKYSKRFRQSIGETLCLLAAFPSALPNISEVKIKCLLKNIVRNLLNNPKVIQIKNLDDIFPFLAECSPETFLEIVEKIIKEKSVIFSEIFNEKHNGFFSHNYFSGLMWSLQGLAWNQDYLLRVIMILGDLATLDKGGNYYPRPLSTIISIFLPWFPQTCASFDIQFSVIKQLVEKYPEIGWIFLKSMIMPSTTSIYNHRPIWAEWIPLDRKYEMSRKDFEKQIQLYRNLIITTVKENSEKILELISHLKELSEIDFDRILYLLYEMGNTILPSEKKVRIWSTIRHEINLNRKFEKAWGPAALNPAQIEKLAKISRNFVPELISDIPNGELLWDLFNEYDFILHEDNQNHNEDYEKLSKSRTQEISTFFEKKGIDKLLQFADIISQKSELGAATGKIDGIGTSVLIKDLIPNQNKEFVHSFINSYFSHNGQWKWVNELDFSKWSDDEYLSFLLYLPCTRDAWDCAKNRLGNKEIEYWKNVTGNPIPPENEIDLIYLIEKYLSVGRFHPAIWVLSMKEYQKSNKIKFPSQLAYLTLIKLSESVDIKQEKTLDPQIYTYNILKLIEILQYQTTIAEKDIRELEWIYLPLFTKGSGVNIKPFHLETQLKEDPLFFCKLIRNLSLPDNSEQINEKNSTFNKNIFTRYYNLFENWSNLPGIEDGNVNKAVLLNWIQKVKTECQRIGYYKGAKEKIGTILARYPSDPSRLWIHKVIAEILDDPGAEDLRNSFQISILNSRGVSVTDGSGNAERKISEEFKERAKDLRLANYHRVAEIADRLANEYLDMADKMSHREI